MIRTGTSRKSDIVYAAPGSDLPVGTMFVIEIPVDAMKGEEPDFSKCTADSGKVVESDPFDLYGACTKCLFHDFCEKLEEDYAKVAPVCNAGERSDRTDVHFEPVDVFRS